MAHKKLKILYIAQLLMEQTDEEHTVTVKDIISYLERLGIPAERKAIYDDLALLEDFGMDIVRTKTKTHNFYLGSRTFELPEAYVDRTVSIYFEGVETAFYLWVNGAFVGYSEDSKLPCSFDVTPFVKEGLNSIALHNFYQSIFC